VHRHPDSSRDPAGGDPERGFGFGATNTPHLMIEAMRPAC
jgi:hypothetical protein